MEHNFAAIMEDIFESVLRDKHTPSPPAPSDAPACTTVEQLAASIANASDVTKTLLTNAPSFITKSADDNAATMIPRRVSTIQSPSHEVSAHVPPTLQQSVVPVNSALSQPTSTYCSGMETSALPTCVFSKEDSILDGGGQRAFPVVGGSSIVDTSVACVTCATGELSACEAHFTRGELIAYSQPSSDVPFEPGQHTPSTPQRPPPPPQQFFHAHVPTQMQHRQLGTEDANGCTRGSTSVQLQRGMSEVYARQPLELNVTEPLGSCDGDPRVDTTLAAITPRSELSTPVLPLVAVSPSQQSRSYAAAHATTALSQHQSHVGAAQSRQTSQYTSAMSVSPSAPRQMHSNDFEDILDLIQNGDSE